MSKKVEFYKTTRCKFNASQTSAVFFTCRVEFVAALIMHVQLLIHGVLVKQFFFLVSSSFLKWFCKILFKDKGKTTSFCDTTFILI